MADKNTEIHQNNLSIEIDTSARFKKVSVRIGGKLMHFDQPKVMGILNITPDSFYEGSRISSLDSALKRAAKMLDEGADILDVGAYSSRPGADDISVEEEMQRLIPIIDGLVKEFPEAVISVDTFRSAVARRALESGAHIINDISAGDLDPDMFSTVAEFKVPYIIMHMKGTPQTMKSLTQYEDLGIEVFKSLQTKMAVLKETGVVDVIVDPGFGFAKTIQQNFEMLAQFEMFQHLNAPLLAGLSRKSMIWKTLGIEPENALNGTTVLNTIALIKGASILRVHDVLAAREAIKLVSMIGESS